MQQLADLSVDDHVIFCHGAWDVTHCAWISRHLIDLLPSDKKTITLDLSHVTHLDTVGASLLQDLMTYLQVHGTEVEYCGLDEANENLLLLVQQHLCAYPEVPKPPSFLVSLGKQTSIALNQVLVFISFFGQIFTILWTWLKQPKRIRWQAIAHQIETTGYQAMGIVALLSFLIGIVLAYQIGHQLQGYGAGIYVVDLLGLSLLREFSPLLTAIIVSGRTGAAFAAQIGTMKLNQEIDALETIGLDSGEILVLPKMLGLIIALPLLTILAMITGIFGGMIMSKIMLGISFSDFLGRFSTAVPVNTLFLGELKAPVFAILIALIGCFQGFQVSNSAASVGTRTTISVVQCIFMIITADAIFSVIYSMLGV